MGNSLTTFLEQARDIHVANTGISQRVALTLCGINNLNSKFQKHVSCFISKLQSFSCDSIIVFCSLNSHRIGKKVKFSRLMSPLITSSYMYCILQNCYIVNLNNVHYHMFLPQTHTGVCQKQKFLCLEHFTQWCTTMIEYFRARN